MDVVRTIVETVIVLGFLVVCGLKGKWGFVVVGFILPIL
jgi:hypothetical protein